MLLSLHSNDSWRMTSDDVLDERKAAEQPEGEYSDEQDKVYQSHQAQHYGRKKCLLE